MSSFPIFGSGGLEGDLKPRGDWVGDAMAAASPGEVRCGVQIPEIRVGEQMAVAIDQSFLRMAHAVNPELAAAILKRDAAQEAVRGWTAQVSELAANVNRFKNLVATASGLQGGKDTDSLRADARVAEDLLDLAREHLEFALGELAECVAAVAAFADGTLAAVTGGGQ
jgi:hypothetical protein